MNLISCDSCGVVLDQDKLTFPTEEELFDENGTMLTDKAAWTGMGVSPIIPCPVCGNPIKEL